MQMQIGGSSGARRKGAMYTYLGSLVERVVENSIQVAAGRVRALQRDLLARVEHARSLERERRKGHNRELGICERLAAGVNERAGKCVPVDTEEDVIENGRRLSRKPCTYTWSKSRGVSKAVGKGESLLTRRT